MTTRTTSRSPWLGLAGWLALSLTAAVVGGLGSLHAKEFYASLTLPAWAPPAWLFGPVWTLLYLMMGVAAWMVWRSKGWVAGGTALRLFVVQLALNALWSWIFFVGHSGLWALLEILLLWGLIVATMAAFWRVRPLAGALLLPYIAWVSFATVLTCTLWHANPSILG